jgi:inhibitor of cysteine peptidase
MAITNSKKKRRENMVPKIQFISILAILMFMATACSPTKPVNLTAADKGSQVSVKVGEQIAISLDGNPSTGYSWEAIGLDTAVFEQMGDATFISSNPGLVGAGGSMTLTFKAVKAGTAVLTLVYHRPWETGVTPLDTFSVAITVK